ncbi:DUF1743 domain-containing protein [Halobaculum sp. MBLA0147]|uniref:TiaS agmantine-binding domain-containing protein n=1 Tax=Halobaculum sp. MBLA0147 TaxID=3079934 RepID=UPI003525691C
MTVVAVDDTDSRTEGMCTTYLAARLADRLADGDCVERRVLVRLFPGVEHKTRGNAALAVHTDAAPSRARRVVVSLAERFAVTTDADTSPGVVVAPHDPDAVPEPVASFARDAIREPVALDRALRVAAEAGYETVGWAPGVGGAGRGTSTDPASRRVTGRATHVGDASGSRDSAAADSRPADSAAANSATRDTVAGRGRVGALAAVGAWASHDDWTYERIDYRAFDRCGTQREVDERSVFAAAADAYPDAWDTVDRVAGEAVCVPNAPGPVLYGVRGDDATAVERVAARIESESVDRSALFVTNQGTDAHLHDARGAWAAGGPVPQTGGHSSLRDGLAYRIDGTVKTAPETRRGGHVFFALEPPERGGGGGVAESGEVAGETPTPAPDALDCVAFEPTGRFRDRVRALRPGDRLTVCGEVADDTVKLEKVAVRELDRTERVVPTCPECERTMESAGRDAGYRCRDCETSESGKVTRTVDRDLRPGWYEVPPCARRHVAKPLVRGGFDAATHPER